MLDLLQNEAPQKGTYSVVKVTDYSNGEREMSVTTVFDPDSLRTRKKDDSEQLHEQLLNSDPIKAEAAKVVLDEFFKEDDVKEISPIDKEENKLRSLRRSKTSIRMKIIEGELDHFLTLTYRENQTDIDLAWQQWKQFIRLVQKKYPTIKYLVILERQKRGAIHFHACINGFLHANTVRALWKKIVGEGNIDLKRRRHNQSLHGLANYICKYLTKQYDEIEDFKNIYRCSRNIKIKQSKFYIPREFAYLRDKVIQQLIQIYVPDHKQHRGDSNGLFSYEWVSSLAP